MLSKFISVSETRFQNTETALKNQQASIQGLETQICQLSKLISERPQGELALWVGYETITLQARNSGNTSGIEGDHLNRSTKTNNMVPPTLQKMSLKEAHESFPSNSREPVHKDWRLQIEELDEWRTYKPRTPNKPKLRQNEPDTSPNQVKVGDKVLLDAADPHIVTTTLNEETLLRCFMAKHTGVLKAV
ncbi:hypothetical protein GOBAR_AA20535 [Gossypium barbadense]|uniref:Uncharacterized protein n=1 Tax=Gossypium barbadense TaxID=3634 RepID=A0A2P5X9W4_GOSBA|nr:hypothetical protein GOBAR_AA20535 [Gossypium barbadense]